MNLPFSYLFKKYKKEKKRFAAITAYDFSFAKIFSEEGIDILLVGDSLGMTIQGHNSTIPVTINDIMYHTEIVRRGAPDCFLISDLPFMTYSTIDKAIINSEKIIRSGANMIKIEGGNWLEKTVKILTERGIPVCGHLGLTPQSINIFGSYKVQGKKEKEAKKIFNDAKFLESAGIKMLVLECIPVSLAKNITESLRIPVIGIGAGNVTDGQILVMHDVLGITSGHIPKFSKNFLNGKGNIRSAIRQYISDVKSGIYPSSEHSFY